MIKKMIHRSVKLTEQIISDRFYLLKHNLYSYVMHINSHFSSIYHWFEEVSIKFNIMIKITGV